MANWLKTTQRRVKEGFFQAVGLHTGTEDQEFDGRLSKFLHFSKDLEKLNASMITWLECLDVMCASTVCISENISRFCENNDDGEPLKHVAHAFSAVEGDINNTLRKTVKLVFTDRCIKPIEAILSIVPLINAKVQDRKNLLLDHDFYKSKLQSEMAAGKDNNHPVIIKVSNKLSEVSKSLEGATSIIVEVVDEVLSFQPKMLQPEIAAMLACMYTLSSSTTSMLEKLLPLVPQSASTSCLLASLIQSDKLPHNEIVRTVREKLSAETSITPVYARPGALGGTAGGYGYIEFGSIHNLTHPSSHVTAARPVSVSSPSPNSTSNSTSVPAYVKAASTNRAISSRQTPIKLGASPGRPQSQDVDAVKVPLLPKADKEDKIKRRSQCIASAGHSSQGRPAQDHDLDHDIDPGEGGGEDKSQTLTSSSMSNFIDEYERTLLGTTHEDGAQQQPPSPSFGLLTAEAVASLGERSAFRGDQAAVFVRAEYDFSSDVPGDLCFKVGDVIEVTSRDDAGWWAGRLHGAPSSSGGLFPSNYVSPTRPP